MINKLKKVSKHLGLTNTQFNNILDSSVQYEIKQQIKLNNKIRIQKRKIKKNLPNIIQSILNFIKE